MTALTFPRNPVVVPGVGPTRARGMIIGEAPGRNEVIEGVPFCGDSGDRLDEALDLAGTIRDKFFITNLFKGDVGTGNRNPRQSEIRDHRAFLIQEMIDVQPMAILLLGQVVAADFFPVCKPLEPWVGKRFQLGRISWFPCWHPANTFRKPKTRPDFEKVVKAFVDHCSDRARFPIVDI